MNMQFTPDLMTMQNGTPVQDWEMRRQELLTLLENHIYGKTPPVRSPGTGRIVHTDPKCCSGHARLESIEITAETEKGMYSYPMHLFMPEKPGRHPLFLLINFRPDPYDMYFPAEEIIDNGFALAVIHYNDMTSDDGDMANGLAGQFTRPTDGTGYGKINLWAWGASRALDYLLTREDVDTDHVAVIGHSRLGKTALWCAAQDTRFRYAFSNDSGCAGAALEHIKHAGAETTEVISRVFPYWFCENYRQYANHPEKMPFDQHFLLAAIAPRSVCVNSASQDDWADPYSEQLCCLAASPAWTHLGLRGFIGPETPAKIGESFHAGQVGYYLRDGVHFLGRSDWLQDMAFVKKHW